MEWTEVAGVVGAIPGVDSRDSSISLEDPVLFVDEGLWCVLRGILEAFTDEADEISPRWFEKCEGRLKETVLEGTVGGGSMTRRQVRTRSFDRKYVLYVQPRQKVSGQSPFYS